MPTPDPDEILDLLGQTDRFVMVPIDLLRHLSTRDALVLCWLKFRCQGGWFDTSGKEFASDLGLSTGQTKAALAVLDDMKLIEWEEPNPLHRRRRYRIVGRDQTVGRSDIEPPDGQKTDQSDGQESDRPPLSLEVEEVVKEPMAADAAAQAFDVFWERYPKSRRRERASCLALFRKARKDLDPIMAGQARWIRYWADAQTEERFITTSIVWLRNRRWEDDPTLTLPAKNHGRPMLRNAPGSALAQGATDRTGESGVW